MVSSMLLRWRGPGGSPNPRTTENWPCRRSRTRSCRLGLVHQQLEHRHGAVAAGDQVARERAQLPEALRVQALEQDVVDAPLVGRQLLDQPAALGRCLEQDLASVAGVR